MDLHCIAEVKLLLVRKGLIIGICENSGRVTFLSESCLLKEVTEESEKRIQDITFLSGQSVGPGKAVYGYLCYLLAGNNHWKTFVKRHVKVLLIN